MFNNKHASDTNFLRPRFTDYFTEWKQDWHKATTKGLKIRVTILRENQINKPMAQLSFRLPVFSSIWKNNKRTRQIHASRENRTKRDMYTKIEPTFNPILIMPVNTETLENSTELKISILSEKSF